MPAITRATGPVMAVIAAPSAGRDSASVPTIDMIFPIPLVIIPIPDINRPPIARMGPMAAATSAGSVPNSAAIAATVFAAMLSDWYSGQMPERLAALGLTTMEFHINWLPDYRCIDIQAHWGKLYVDIQIEPASFTIAMDEIEPDEPMEYALVSAEGFYDTLRDTL